MDVDFTHFKEEKISYHKYRQELYGFSPGYSGRDTCEKIIIMDLLKIYSF